MSLKKLRNLLVFDYEEFFEPTNEVGQKKNGFTDNWAKTLDRL